MNTYVILHNIRSAHNVGSIFRTADGAGVSRIYLTGYTPAPIDRFGRVCKEIEKTSLGATAFVSWEHVEDVHELITQLHHSHISVIAIEQHEHADDFATMSNEGDRAYIFGNEIDGVDLDVCARADRIIYIPMHGKKESLNVSVTAGIILFTPHSRRNHLDMRSQRKD